MLALIYRFGGSFPMGGGKNRAACQKKKYQITSAQKLAVPTSSQKNGSLRTGFSNTGGVVSMPPETGFLAKFALPPIPVRWSAGQARATRRPYCP